MFYKTRERRGGEGRILRPCKELFINFIPGCYLVIHTIPRGLFPKGHLSSTTKGHFCVDLWWRGPPPCSPGLQRSVGSAASQHQVITAPALGGGPAGSGEALCHDFTKADNKTGRNAHTHCMVCSRAETRGRERHRSPNPSDAVYTHLSQSLQMSDLKYCREQNAPLLAT